MFKQKLLRMKFPTKTPWTHVSISPKNGPRGHQIFAIFEIMHWNGEIDLIKG